MNELVLTGLDGGNPLGFLAALGTLRALANAWPDRHPRMSWVAAAGWQPVLHTHVADEAEVVDAVHGQIAATKEHETLRLADNLTIPAEIYRSHLLTQVEKAPMGDCLAYVSAFGCDAIRDQNNNIADTALRTMSGAGHQHFLKTMCDILTATTTTHIAKTLFQQWRYDDALQKFSLRFDPLDDKRRALQWRDPSGDPSRRKDGNMLGANALAILGIPLIVAVPVRDQLETTGFRGHRSNDCFWTWPIWEMPLTLDIVLPLLALQELQEEHVQRDVLMTRGITEVYRSQRITVGKFRNFTPAQPV